MTTLSSSSSSSSITSAAAAAATLPPPPLLPLSVFVYAIYFSRILQVRPGTQRSAFGNSWSRVFLGYMLFLSPNQHCQSAEGTNFVKTMDGNVNSAER